MNPYPNNPKRSPTAKPLETKRKENELKSQMVRETPILEWLDAYLDNAIAEAQSIDRIKLDYDTKTENIVSQVMAMKLLKNHLSVIKGEINQRFNIAKD